MSNSKGFSSEKKTTDQKYQTIQPLGQGKYGSDTSPIKGLTAIDLTSYVPEITSTQRYIDLTGHPAIVGDVLKFDSGLLIGQEVSVVKVEANRIHLGNVQDTGIIPADTFGILRPTSLAVDSDGNLTISSGPVQYIKDAAVVSTEIDTAVPANNMPLPTALYTMKDGVIYPVSKDTGTPSNTHSIPVEIVGVNGTEINITAGDINVQTSHLGANADSMRIGNGVNEMGVNANLEALTRDNDAITELVAIKALDFSTETTLAAVLAKIIAAPATEAKQDTIITALDVIAAASNRVIHESTFNLAANLATGANFAVSAAIAAGTIIKEIRVNYKNGDTLQVYAGNVPLGMITQGGGSVPVSIIGDNTLVINVRAINANFTANDLVVSLIREL